MLPDYGQSQHENHSHSKTLLLDYSAANVANSAFCSGVTDTLPSVCASLTKAIVHCNCTCDSLLNFGILYL